MAPLNQLLNDHKIWIDLFTAVGTVGATIIALVVSIGSWLRSHQEQHSAVTLTNPSSDGTVFIENSARIDLQVSIEKNNELIPDPENETYSRDYQQVLQLESLKKSKGWQTLQEEITLSPGQRIPIHLADLNVERTYVALAGLRITTNGKTMYSVYRFAGQKAEEHTTLRSVTHPHRTWVLVFQK